tara:strand:+ start:12145 stop:12381 length:237 start_codon:yes stop_codon:yes gene_type:complete
MIANIIITISLVVMIALAVYQSVQTEKRCKKRDIDYREFVLAVEAGDALAAKQLYNRWPNDPVFARCVRNPFFPKGVL